MEDLIQPFVENYITKLYPKVNRLRVGASHSKGLLSQYKLSGCYHRDYLQDVVHKRIEDEWPFSIILVLDEFQLQYKNGIIDEEVETVCVPIRHAAIFLSALSHWGGENGTQDYVHHFFAYVVSNKVDYPQGVIERDLEDDFVK
jgi:hypothetical protein